MQLEKRKNLWTSGNHKGYRFIAKVYDEGSMFGINDGRVSKLWVKNEKINRVIFNYDRGIDIAAKTQEDKAIVAEIVHELEALPKMWP